MSDNLDLWRSVCTTDPRAVKPITGKQYKGSSPKPYWLIERATERFGPIGIGWGVTVKSERFERLSETDVLHVAVVSVWFMHETSAGTRVRSETFDQMGGTKAAYKTNAGALMVDEDAGKKSVTDGMVKCLSMIGFAGDIFAGMWDDSKYVQWAGEEWARREHGVQQEEQTSGNAQNGTEANRAAFRELQPETQDHLRQRAITIDAAAMTNAKAAKEMVDQAVAEWPEEDPSRLKMGLWSLLDSKTKTAIRKLA